MTSFQVERTQYPIGQGGFHSMALYSRTGNNFSMVVDCGGSREGHRKLLAKAFAEREHQHDFLAISHLDDDHINGLEELKEAGVSFRTVFLPHVDMSSYLKWMTLKLSDSDSEGEVLAEFAKIATRLYAGHFGPVVSIRGPGEDGGARNDPLPPPDEDDDHEDDDNYLLSNDTRLAIERAKGANGTGLTCSTSLTFDLDWLIRFYSLEWSLPNEIASIWDLPLLQGLRNVINSINASFTSTDWVNFTADLKSELKKKVLASHSKELATLVPPLDPCAAALVKLGKEVALGKMSCKEVLTKLYKITTSLHDYNDASMCVYSGPSERGIGVPRRSFRRLVLLSRLVTATPSSTQPRAVGWIHTGDANFKDHSRLQAFLDHYITEAPLTSVFVLPHHGSRRSFDPAMDRLRGLGTHLARPTVFVAPADPQGKYHHPDSDVIHTCHLLGSLAIVDEDAASCYSDSATTLLPWDLYWTV
ncbi:hypothetical protein FHR55_003518 [Xanthomonas arboricola]